MTASSTILFCMAIILMVADYRYLISIPVPGKKSEDASDKSVRREGFDDTVDLIGEDSFDRMADNIEQVLEHTEGKQCVVVPLTAAEPDLVAQHKLHSLLPGDPLQLVPDVEGDNELVEVYSGDIRIGTLAFEDAQAALAALLLRDDAEAYVSEQNCYGNSTEIDLGIVIFFTDPARRVLLGGVKSGTRPILFFQN